MNEEDVELGRVSGFMETGANDVMVLEGDRQRMVPFALGAVIRDVNLKQAEFGWTGTRMIRAST